MENLTQVKHSMEMLINEAYLQGKEDGIAQTESNISSDRNSKTPLSDKDIARREQIASKIFDKNKPETKHSKITGFKSPKNTWTEEHIQVLTAYAERSFNFNMVCEEMGSSYNFTRASIISKLDKLGYGVRKSTHFIYKK